MLRWGRSAAACAPDEGNRQMSEAWKRNLTRIDGLRVSALLTGDIGELENLVSGRLVYHHASGSVDTKSSYLAPIRSRQLIFLEIAQTNVSLDIVGSTGIFRGSVRNRVTINGEESTLTANYFNVWALEAGNWQMV